MFTQFIATQYCYDFLASQIPFELLVYTHIPTAIIALLFGAYLITKDKSLSGISLFGVSIGFALWCLFDLSTWFSFLGANTTMFTWSILDLIGLIFFFFSYYFLYTFTTKKDLPFWQKVLGFALILPTSYFTFFGRNLSGFEANYCEAIENPSYTSYFFYAAAVFLLATIIFTVIQSKRAKDRGQRRQTLLAGLGIVLFLFFFYSALLSVSLLAETNLGTYAYNFEIYGLFGMPILLGFLTYLVVRYHAFNIKLIGSQALVLALLVLIGSQFFFIDGSSARILNIITIIFALIFGHFLVRGVKREIRQKDRLQELSVELEKANLTLAMANEKLKGLDKLKTEFLSLASHQLRSPLTAIKGYASMMNEGDFGKLNDKQGDAAKRIYSSAQGLANLVEDLLNVSKIEQGGMQYEFMPTDIAKTVADLAAEMKIPVENKKLELRTAIGRADRFMANADPVKIRQVFLNLVDNSIKYTPTGFVEIGLKRDEKHNIVFYVKDNGIGITEETKNKLFEKFSRGDGAKVNTGGSGLGLYLAHEIVKAHKGEIKVESEGQGKGSTFSVVLPPVESQKNGQYITT